MRAGFLITAAASIATDAIMHATGIFPSSPQTMSDPLFVLALMRQESMFDHEAQSPVGALGLMQLMPGTAKTLAKRAGVSYSAGKLTNADYNIRLGSEYLEELLDRYDGSYPLAIAAYNAGPARVDDWLDTFGDPRHSKADFIDWIEMMPIYETRNYVQRVLENTVVYDTINSRYRVPMNSRLSFYLGKTSRPG